jgi:hypothetical protein
MKDMVPASLNRRLMLSLLGWRFDRGVWSLGGQTLTEEDVDRMSARAWQAFVRLELVSAGAMK